MSEKHSDAATIDVAAPALADCVELYVDVVSDEWGDALSITELVQDCVASTLNAFPDADVPLEISLRLTDDADIEQLNREFREQDKPTNVLSFAAFEPTDLKAAYVSAAKGGPPVMLGDIIITHGVTSREAREQGKTFQDHLAHLVVHGLLHLLGFDHIEDGDAEEMEASERRILALLGIDDPYREGN